MDQVTGQCLLGKSESGWLLAQDQMGKPLGSSNLTTALQMFLLQLALEKVMP